MVGLATLSKVGLETLLKVDISLEHSLGKNWRSRWVGSKESVNAKIYTSLYFLLRNIP